MIDPDFFARMAIELQDEPNAAQTVGLIAEYACSAMACDDAGILIVHSRRKIETAAATSSRVGRLHDLQITLDEGPCLDSIEDPKMFLSCDLAADPKYPRWGEAAADLGVQSALSVPLQTKSRRYGSLNLYAEPLDGFDERDLEVASIFGRHAAVALASAQSEEGLHVAVDARHLIGLAQGILMERFDLDADRAFDFLRRHSQQNNIKLRDVAEAVVENRRTWTPAAADAAGETELST